MKQSHALPTVSVVMATYNSTRTLHEVLKSIRAQDYPKDRIEICIADGGSQDATREIAKSFGAYVYRVNAKKQNAEYNKAVALSHATHEIIAMIDHDNILPHKGWLRAMVQPFMDRDDVVGVETLRYQYDPNAALLDRYFALFGSGDPVVWYLGKTDRLSYMFDSYNLRGKVLKTSPYTVVRFREDTMPTIGANGFLVRRTQLFEHADIRPGWFFDMDVNIDLVRAGFDTYAFVDEGILHKTGYGSLWYYFKRRILFLSQYHVTNAQEDAKRRRFTMVSPRDMLRLAFSTLAILTLVIPLYESIRGYRKIRDYAWFLHPFMGYGFVFIYAWVIIRHTLRRYAHTHVE